MSRILFILIFFVVSTSSAQIFKASTELRLNVNNEVPYWLKTNQFGSRPLSGLSGTFIGKISKETTSKPVDYGFHVEGRADLGNRTKWDWIEANAFVKLGPFELKGGRSKEFMGLVDSTLSVGSFSMSGNALGIPKIEFRIPEYWPRNSFIAIKGNFAHGWYGYSPTKNTLSQVDSLKTYFHQKSLYIRVKPLHERIRLYAGIVDNAFWGDEYRMHSSFDLTKAQRYWSVVSGKNWQDSKVGNHAGNIDVRAEYDAENLTFSLYRQFFYEVGALWHLANIADGLMGVSIEPQNKELNIWHKLLLEVIYTKNQAGEPWSKPTPTGNENYLNHYMYNNGWSYKNMGLGLPLITARNDARADHPYSDLEYFVNNRLWGINLGGEGKFHDWETRIKLTYTRNFGTRATENTFNASNQVSIFLDGGKSFGNNWEGGFMLGADFGKLLPNASGLTIYTRKRWL